MQSKEQQIYYLIPLGVKLVKVGMNLGVGWPELIRDMRGGSREPREPPQPTGLRYTMNVGSGHKL